MEGGSLLQEALDYVKQHRQNGGLNNTLLIDAFHLVDHKTKTKTKTKTRAEAFIDLVSICAKLNQDLSSYLKGYPWFSGGEGPAFGIHVTDGIPHLRAICRYGSNVNDEWCMIAAVINLSTDMLFQCWDIDDGHILLIEAAMHLPLWIDQLGPAKCRHRCWIVDGHVTLINNAGKESLSLKEAIHILCSQSNDYLETPPKITEAINKKVESLQTERKRNWKGLLHRTALVLPRNIAILLHSYPYLAFIATVAFDNFSATRLPPDEIPFQDLVWTTLTLGRTNYALLRTSVNQIWRSEDFIPKSYKSVETNRIKRVCQVESTPHLKNALQLGVRIVAGLAYILGQDADPETPYSANEQILKHWVALDAACGGNGDWLQSAWSVGPNNSTIDLTAFIRCPIATVDLLEAYPCPLSQPGKTTRSMIRQALRKNSLASTHDFETPNPQSVDSEEWMQQELYSFDAIVGTPPANVSTMDTSKGEGGKEEDTQVLDKMLGDFKTFVEDTSDLEGVTTSTHAHDGLGIDTDMFASVLQKMISSVEGKISAHTQTDEDRYFSREDYDVFEGKDSDSDVDALDHEDNGSSFDEELKATMAAMDEELKSTPVFSGNDLDTGLPHGGSTATEEIKVLTHLLESLDSSQGAPGPARNILNEIRDSSQRTSK